MQRPLLLLTCSARKRRDAGELPALERYDGPMFRVLRRFGRQYPATEIETFILSAHFGWVSAQTSLPLYDQQPNGDQNWEIQAQRALTNLVSNQDWRPIFVDVGARYRSALGTVEQIWPASAEVQWAQGAPGMRAAQLRLWLQHLTPDANLDTLTPVPYARQRACHQASFRGERVSVEAAQLRDLATRWRDLPKAPTARPFHWSVAILLPCGVQSVPLKWLVSQLVGVPPGKFSTSQAAAFLRDIEMEDALFSNFPENIRD